MSVGICGNADCPAMFTSRDILRGQQNLGHIQPKVCCRKPDESSNPFHRPRINHTESIAMRHNGLGTGLLGRETLLSPHPM